MANNIADFTLAILQAFVIMLSYGNYAIFLVVALRIIVIHSIRKMIDLSMNHDAIIVIIYILLDIKMCPYWC